MDCSNRLLSFNYGLLWGIVADYVVVLGFQGTHFGALKHMVEVSVQKSR